MRVRPQVAGYVVAAHLASAAAAGAGAHATAAEGRGPSIPASPLAAIEKPRTAPGSGGSDEPEAGYGQRAGEYSRLDLDELMAVSGTPGLAIAVFHDFEIVWTHERGVADLETGRKVEADTLFQAASISKPVGAAAVLRAVDDGLFTLDTPINDILERWRLPENAFTAGRPVTPRLLLSHTAGTTMPGFPGYSPDAAIPTELEVLDEAGPTNTAAVRVDTRPGTAYRYSGGGTTVLQVALADAAGRPYREVL
ncbi:MAG: serine hydrolase domain-containing protein, partial [Thermoanaerobaculia bacterium]|nr:serine hydrolase domain-containing protein [Thermoanaerobaculia bacterium]